MRATATALHFQFFEKLLLAEGSFRRIGDGATYFEIITDEQYSESVHISDHKHALRVLIDHLHRNSHIKALLDISAVVYRISHGGDEFKATTLLRPDDLHRLESIKHLTPEGAAVDALVAAGLNQLPSAAHIGVFDTAFYRLLPESQYALLPKLNHELHIKRHGFHGIIHKAAYDALQKKSRRVISVHIDDDVSVTAILDGVGVDTTTGFTAAEGLPGLHRSGSVDPRIPLYLATHLHVSPQQIDTLLSTKSGFAAYAGKGSYAEIRGGARKQDPTCISALMMLTYKVSQAIAAMSAALGGIDCLVFSGQGASWEIIEEICRRLSHLGVRVAKSKGRILSKRSRVTVLRIALDESKILLAEARRIMKRK